MHKVNRVVHLIVLLPKKDRNSEDGYKPNFTQLLKS